MATKKVSTNGTYQANVLDANKALKDASTNLGGAIRRLLLFAPEINLHADFKKVLNVAIKGNNNATYVELAKNVRRSKKGNVAPFYVLQYVNKNLPALLITAGIVKGTKEGVAAAKEVAEAEAAAK